MSPPLLQTFLLERQAQQTLSSINCLGHGIVLQQEKRNNTDPMLTAPAESLGPQSLRQCTSSAF